MKAAGKSQMQPALATASIFEEGEVDEQASPPAAEASAAKCPISHEWMAKLGLIKAKEPAMPGEKYDLTKISCPYLATQVNTGRLEPDPKTGYVTNEAAMQNLKQNGFDEGGAKFFVDAADKADAHPAGFSVYEMRTNALNHPGSSRVRDTGFKPELLAELTNFADKNGRFYKSNFAAAAHHFASNATGEGGKLRGTFIVNIEYSSTLQVFGRLDEHGDKFMTVEDLRRLYIDNKPPTDWAPPPENSVTKGILFGGAFKLAFLRTWQRMKAFFGA